MFKTKLSVHLTCPKHTRYTGLDPGGIKGACPICTEICAVVDLLALAREHIAALEVTIAKTKAKQSTKGE